MESHLTGAFGDQVEIELVPSSGGCFEVDISGKRIYSKLETGAFPSNQAIAEKVRQILT